ncbi:type II toxin-antitoxin system YafQ family toxin [Candidatus Magnetominusculus xianensis]|uniref:Damage-inducible protein n=1 Tax=Candidatus Magnetominusculus xianensis TaxID=1748249 RepID=A0ABR5SGP3_9BACT|nr:type II toxin-antitoxin system YafQ family toxin [Candidatus Magnetominusculus xianensis]KWT90489.1 damage-inducible protein [Candidatus Magnetominusculus xianensis]MBF0404185.1 type II toxin-antitoxin system YafQ family toxin [Nitrospirota bacterium]
MKYKPARTGQFKKDIKQMLLRGADVKELFEIMTKLTNGEKLDPKHRDHKLAGNYIGRRECHIKSDWLMIYKIDGDCIIFERSGTHSDLFD